VQTWRYAFLRYEEAKSMDLIAAMNIVQALHLGKSPETDEPLPPGSIACRRCESSVGSGSRTADLVRQPENS